MDEAQIQADILAAIRTAVPNIHLYDFFHPSPDVPCAIAVWGTIGYRETFDGTATTTLFVKLLSPDVNTKAGQQQLESWVSTDTDSSVVNAIETVPNVAVTRATNEGVIPYRDGREFLSTRLDVDILL